MKLMVAVPTTDYVHADFMKCLVDLMANLHRQKINADVKIVPGTLVYIARNRLACEAINGGYTHVLWLDSDMIFDKNVVDDLMFCGKEMVCGAFVSRRPPYQPCIFSSLEKGQIEKIKDFGTQPFKVAGCGFACVLTEVQLLKDVQMKYGTCFTPTEYYGEDLAFCVRVGNIGREIWCDPSVRPGHIAHVPVYAGDQLFREPESEKAGD